MLQAVLNTFAFLTNIPRLADEDQESNDRKRTLGVTLQLGSVALIGLGVVFLAFTQHIAASIAFGYFVYACCSAVVLRITGRGFDTIIYSNCILIHFVAFMLMFVLGGFLPSGCIYMWAFISPLTLALVPKGRLRLAIVSLLVFIFLIGVGVFLGETTPVHIDRALTNTLVIVNFVVFSATVMVATATLVQRLGRTSGDLLVLNRTLDQRVQLRTAELVRKNVELRQEVQERKRAEQALVESEARLRHSQKMESIGRLTGGIAHDFNNMLTVILSYCDLSLVSLSDEDPICEDISEIRRAAQRASNLTRQLLAFSRQQIFEVKSISLGELIAGMRQMFDRVIGEDVELEVQEIGTDTLVLADRGQLEQVLMNLVVNARDAMPDGGRLEIATERVVLDREYVREHPDAKLGEHVCLRVSDSGHGMDSQTLRQVFEPFFTTKPTGLGTGLGLSTAYGIIKQSGGSIEVDSEIGVGTTFRIYLAVAESPEEKLVVTPKPRHVSPGSETILLVEDEDQVREVIGSILTRNGYRVLSASCPSEALEVEAKHDRDIQLLLTDLVMPEMNGRQLADEILRRRPNICISFMSGYTSEVTLRMGIETGSFELIPKPILPGDLVLRVRELLDAVSE